MAVSELSAVRPVVLERVDVAVDAAPAIKVVVVDNPPSPLGLTMVTVFVSAFVDFNVQSVTPVVVFVAAQFSILPVPETASIGVSANG